MAYLPLTKGQEAIVDTDKLALVLAVSQNWYWKKGYAFCTFQGQPIKLHNLLLKVPAGLEVDHENNNGLDCRMSNLREANRSQQTANTRRHGRFRGVHAIPGGKFRARLKSRSGTRSLGCFDSEEEAARAWDTAAIEAYGKFAKLNFPSDWLLKGIA